MAGVAAAAMAREEAVGVAVGGMVGVTGSQQWESGWHGSVWIGGGKEVRWRERSVRRRERLVCRGRRRERLAGVVIEKVSAKVAEKVAGKVSTNRVRKRGKRDDVEWRKC